MFIFSPYKLRQVRTDKGFSREWLAVAAGSQYNAIALYENGHRVPSRSSLLRLAAALGVPARDLCEEDPAFMAAAR